MSNHFKTTLIMVGLASLAGGLACQGPTAIPSMKDVAKGQPKTPTGAPPKDTLPDYLRAQLTYP